MVHIKFAKCRGGAKIPCRAEGSAGLDIYPCFAEDYVRIEPGQSRLVSTGIMSAIDPDYFALIEERGSTAVKGVKKSAGVIDANFRGEWWVCIYNSTEVPMYISKLSEEETKRVHFEKSGLYEIVHYPYEKAMAQALILPVPDLDCVEIDEEELVAIPSNRGNGQLGSSGK